MMNFIYLHCFILFVLLHGVISDHRNVLDSRVCFDDKFSFGVATASYQIEGAWNVSGKGESIWDRYTHAHPDMVVDRSNADVADGSYYKVKEDVALMVKLGIGFYRFSIAWSRILPIGLSNYVNEDGIRYYKELLAELRRNHITPVATMYHFDLPQNLQELGGWTNPIMADYFVDYARVLLDTFGDEIKIWLTFNEPYTFCEDGYGGIEAPGANSSGFEDYLCGHNVLRAHGMVYRMFDKEYRKKIGGHMGITLDFSWLEPATTSVEDQQAAETARQFYFGWFAHPIFSKYGDYPPVMRSMIDANSKRQGFYHSRLPYFTSKEVEMIRGSYDFLGLNHYTTYLVKHGSRRISLQPSFIDDMNVIKFQRDEWPKTNSSWLKMTDEQGFQKPKPGFATIAVHAGHNPDKWNGAVAPPVVMSTMYKQAPEGHKGYVYSRSANPMRDTLQECLAALEGAKYAFTFASGQGATTSITSLLSKGDHLVSIDDVYGGTSRLMRENLPRHGIDVTFTDITDLNKLENAIQDNTKMVWLETPTNPNCTVVDLAATVQAVKKRGDIIVVVDNTFLTCYLQRPLDFGADIVMYSLTKYMNGHSDVVMGAAVLNSQEIADKLRIIQKSLGIVPSAFDCYQVNRSLKTLSLRMERHKATSLVIAKWLEKHPNVIEVLHPGLTSHKGHEVSKRQTSGHSGVFSFRHTGDLKESRKLLSCFKVFILAESLGGYESLAEIPSIMTHKSVPPPQKAQLGITDSLVRFSIGLEDPEDLIKDLENAFKETFNN